MTDAPHLLVDEEDGILIATFNRPEKYNALSSSLMAGLEEAVYRFRDTPRLRVMLIRAKGKYFSSGADLKEGGGGALPTTGSGIREMHRRLPNRMRQIWDEMEHIEKPFVVAHQGMCVGGSLEMSLSCDFRLAAASAGYAFPEAKFGVLPATNGVSRLTRVVGAHWARLLIMANLPASAQEALTMGLVHKVYPDESFEADVMAFCRHLTQQNGEMMGAAKLTIELAADLGADQAAAVERMANSTLMLSPDYQEGMKRHIASIGRKKA
ncbi:enoyl-CoA hydratase/isomerase family protein [Sphingomonas solaris]|uniref:Enoyl-CoA hydratase/isomerase family protein n=1 Tax=Alterirhizorhabdus solaris TaxID=2529389 RepID=A0A558RB77_9SPHN|nr:enoyl-CoA hydratase/isomerase family protein [Sphingomonas solaris]TVV76613.1 enoyl-CoA hydratase/isomerase family protein [Sphingomonas solaris]